MITWQFLANISCNIIFNKAPFLSDTVQDLPVLTDMHVPALARMLNTLRDGWFWGLSAKKHLNARGFAHEYLRSCSL